MQRACDVCGKAYQAKRATSKFCGSSCRARASTSGGRAEKPAKVAVAALPEVEGGLVAVTRAQLVDVDRLDTILGQQALALAARIDSPHETGASVASLSKEFRAVIAEAMEGVTAKADPLDELKRRRELKRSAG